MASKVGAHNVTIEEVSLDLDARSIRRFRDGFVAFAAELASCHTHT